MGMMEEARAGHDLYAKFETSEGTITVRLFPKDAPKTVENFVGLATGEKEWTHPGTMEKMKGVPLYDGTILHRCIKDFMIQGGDPLGTGTGGPGYLIVDEIDQSLRHVGPGILSMANRGPNTGSSQFFLTVAATPHLDNKHAVFGKCDSKVAIEISKVKTRADRPLDDVKINTLTFERAKK